MLSHTKPRRVVLLSEFKQNDPITRLQIDTPGYCAGVTGYYLCSHMYSKEKNLDALIKTEPEKIKAIESNFADVMLLQKHLEHRLSKHESKAITDLGVVSFGHKKAAFVQTDCQIYPFNNVLKGDQGANHFVNHVRAALNDAPDHAHIDFQYRWVDSQIPIAQNKVQPSDERRVLGHAIVFIKNPTPDCDLIFMDCNGFSYAFSHIDDFYKYLPKYFKSILQKDGIPFGHTTRYAVDVTPKLSMQSRPLLQGIIHQEKSKDAALREIVVVPSPPATSRHVIDIHPSPSISIRVA